MRRALKQSKLYAQVSTAGLCDDPRVQAHVPAMRYLWRVHLQGCLRKGVPCLISIDDYSILSKQLCHYCGCEPWNKSKHVTCENVVYNGVDRVDNAVGYTHGNVVTCCKTCNAMKSKLDTATFLEHVARVAAHQQSRVAD